MLPSVSDMASSVSASLDTSLSLVLLTGAREPTWQAVKASLLYDLKGGGRAASVKAAWTLANRWTVSRCRV